MLRSLLNKPHFCCTDAVILPFNGAVTVIEFYANIQCCLKLLRVRHFCAICKLFSFVTYLVTYFAGYHIWCQFIIYCLLILTRPSVPRPRPWIAMLSFAIS